MIEEPELQLDLATVIGLAGTFALLAVAISISGGSGGSFIDLASILIVVAGTAAVTAISYTGEELGYAWHSLVASISRHVTIPAKLAEHLIDLSTLARKRGTLAISTHDTQLSRIPFLKQAMQLVADGFQAHDIENFLQQDIETGIERQRKAASILRRASDIAPGMGLIGTLIGLIQMLSQLDNPSTIGPSMAVALITTFYGALLGTVVLAPLASKIDRNSAEEALIKTLILAASTSIARQENPRRLEIVLNSILPATQRIRYYD